jgi:hypothetical protein
MAGVGINVTPPPDLAAIMVAVAAANPGEALLVTPPLTCTTRTGVDHCAGKAVARW